MIYSIYRDKSFVKRLNELREDGGVSSAAARKADEIIAKILLKGKECSYGIARLTNNGELRIKSCIKYDLGNGYRLVCLKRGTLLICVYIGTHDECGRWLERNRNLEYHVDAGHGDSAPVGEYIPDDPSPEEADIAEEYEQQLVRDIDDRILRKIFRGICER